MQLDNPGCIKSHRDASGRIKVQSWLAGPTKQNHYGEWSGWRILSSMCNSNMFPIRRLRWFDYGWRMCHHNLQRHVHFCLEFLYREPKGFPINLHIEKYRITRAIAPLLSWPQRWTIDTVCGRIVNFGCVCLCTEERISSGNRDRDYKRTRISDRGGTARPQGLELLRLTMVVLLGF